MGTVPDRKAMIDEIWKLYDPLMTGYLTAEQVQQLHEEMRIGGISLPQVKAAIEYTCLTEEVEKSELFDLLQEMDRRYFLIQDFRWEFTMLDREHKDAITEEQAKWFMETVHGKFFSNWKWEKFIRRRAIPLSGVTFAEIEVDLCNIPSKSDLLEEEQEQRREREETKKKEKELAKAAKEERERLAKRKEEEMKRRAADERKKLEEESSRRRKEEDDKRKRQAEKQEAEKTRRRLKEEEEQGKREAEERERREKLDAEKRAEEEKEQEERRRKQREQEELLEAKRLQEEVERRRIDDEATRKREAEEAKDAESKMAIAYKEELEAEEAAKKAKDPKERERQKLKAKEARNRRIRYNLKAAVKRRDRDKLPPAVDEFKKARLPDTDMDLAKAERILLEFQAQDGLKKAMSKRQLVELEKAINFIKKHGFELQFAAELIEANKLLLQLRRLERIRAEILELKQSTVAEIRSYQKPPTVVHIVMTATFLLLRHKEREMKDWKTIQALVGKTGKEGLKRRCLELEPRDIHPGAGARAKEICENFDLDDVRDVSAGAATFYVWAMTMIDEMEQIQAIKQMEDEEKQKKKEEKQKQKEEEERKKKEESTSDKTGAVK